MLHLATIITRLRHTKGYGVQSPTDYHFIKDIINQKLPYYQYKQLKTTNRKKRKINQLLLRLANFCQPENILNQTDDTLATKYMEAGCKKAKTTKQNENKKTIILTTIKLINHNTIYTIAPQSIIIVEDINKNKQTKQHWNNITTNNNITTTYDTPQIGIIITGKRQYPKHYKIYLK